MTWKAISMFLAIGIIGAAQIGFAADNQTESTKQPAAASASSSSHANAAENEHAFLGVAVEPLPPAFASQLPGAIKNGAGILVVDVAEGSPAAKAGLKADDILVSYDDQRLYSSEQFVKLVQNDKSDRQVKLGVIHNGKHEEIEAELGERPAAERQQVWGAHWPMQMRGERPTAENNREDEWRSFDSLTLSRVDKDHYKAEIKFRDDHGKLESRAFQGTREQIRNDVEAQKDLPANERNQLLRAIAMSNRPLEMAFPFVEYIPNNEVMWDYNQLPYPTRGD
jgi:membrane-associated protease RseP (regulator of RpoE activity)